MSTTVSDGTGPILMDNVGCYGWESQLIDCSHKGDTSEDTNDRDVAIHCIPGEPILTFHAPLVAKSVASRHYFFIPWCVYITPPIGLSYDKVRTYVVMYCTYSVNVSIASQQHRNVHLAVGSVSLHML